MKRLANIYHCMKLRCCVPGSPSYERYGAKGIKICNDWLANPENFFKWALENGYTDELTIDRIDNTKGYSPDNCRWATPKEQANNRVTNLSIHYLGKVKTLKQWCDELGLSYKLMYKRIVVHHWSAERAFETDDNPQLRLITYKGKTQPLKTWCKELDLPYLTVYYRLGKLHWPVEKAFEIKIRRFANGRKN